MRDRCAHARATRTRAAGGEHPRGWTRSQSAPVAQPSALLVVKTGRLRRRPSHNGKRRMPVIAGSVCTHLLPWGCHTIMELVLAALPVETTGALLRTGAMAEIAAILFVRAVMPELAPHYGLLFFFPVTPRWTCTRGFARVGSWKQLSEKKHDKTEACFWLRGRIYGVCSVMTPKSPSHGRTVSDSAGSSSDWIRPGSRGAA